MTPPQTVPETVPLQQTPADAPPLLDALHTDSAVAAAAWQSWRRSVDIQQLTWPEMQLLPLLNGPRLDEWLADDPAGGIMKSIVRRAWSEAQVRLGMARDVVARLHQSGCKPVTLIGAAGAYLHCLNTTAIRPVLELRILIPRWHLPLAAAVLEAEGWQPRDKYPEGDALERRSHRLYDRNGSRLYLHWRVLDVEPRHTAACEREFLSRHTTVEAIGTHFRILTPADGLLEALSGHSESVDVLAWQAEAALLLTSNPTRPFDWSHFHCLATRLRPGVLDSLVQLRALGFGIPESSETAPPASLLARALARILWRA